MSIDGFTWLDPRKPEQAFPELDQALQEPNGLLAAGGDLSPQRLLSAYQQGIFPWYSEGEPIMWWSPDPRSVIFPDQLKVSRSLKKMLNKALFTVTFDSVFSEVIKACAAPRNEDDGTWISPDMIHAYCKLHELGYAHSVEVWQNNELVGGLYGIAIGKVFFGESMFHRQSDASKIGFVQLIQQLSLWGFQLIDCQVTSEHMDSLGARLISRKEFIAQLKQHCQHTDAGKWHSAEVP